MISKKKKITIKKKKKKTDRIIAATSNSNGNLRPNRKTTKTRKKEIGRKMTVWKLQATN